MTLHDRIRLAYGLRWRSRWPSFADLRDMLRTAGIVGTIIAAYAVAAYIDDLDARAAEMEQRAEAATRAANIYAGYKQVIKDCDKGAIGFTIGERGYLCSVRVHP